LRAGAENGGRFIKTGNSVIYGIDGIPSAKNAADNSLAVYAAAGGGKKRDNTAGPYADLYTGGDGSAPGAREPPPP
jgi:hypothetical protein